jgi:RNA polymerase sigma-70 factor (ECF subfamily)
MASRGQFGPSESDGSGALRESDEKADAVALVGALRSGDPGAPGELFDRYGMSIRRVLVRIIGSGDPENSDLLHDTFVRALESLDRLRTPASLKSWLRGIAVFTAMEWRRTRKRMGHPQSPATVPEQPAVAASPETREVVRAVYQVLDTFPEEERIAFILRFIERMELDEVADALRVSQSTARRRIKRAENRFRKALPFYPAIAERLEKRP